MDWQRRGPDEIWTSDLILGYKSDSCMMQKIFIWCIMFSDLTIVTVDHLVFFQCDCADVMAFSMFLHVFDQGWAIGSSLPLASERWKLTFASCHSRQLGKKWREKREIRYILLFLRYRLVTSSVNCRMVIESKLSHLFVILPPGGCANQRATYRIQEIVHVH